MMEGTMTPSADVVGDNVFDVEYTTRLLGGNKRISTKISDFPRVSTLRNLFAKVELLELTAEARQMSLIGDNGDLGGTGHVYLAIIPTARDSDAQSGSSAPIIENVPNKQTFSLLASGQSIQTFHFRLSGYEVDVAQDPRRGAGPVVWVGNSGVTASAATDPICAVTWRAKLRCTGQTPLWA